MTSSGSVNDCVWDVRAELRISEAKNLIVKKDGDKLNPFVEVRVDEERVSRTITQRKTLNPYFGETFHLALPHNFGKISCVIFDQDKDKRDGKNEKIGLVEFTRSELLQNMKESKERWYPVTKAGSSVCCHGEIFVELLHTTGGKGRKVLEVLVVKGRDLYNKEYTGKCEPYFVVECGNRVDSSTPRKGSKFPLWDQSFSFEDTALPQSVTITINDVHKISGTNVLGQVTINTSSLERDVRKSQWYRLRARHQDIQDNSVGMGSIRMLVKLSHQLIMPSIAYSTLTDAILLDLNREDAAEKGIVGLLSDLIAERNRPAHLNRDLLASSLMRALDLDDAVLCLDRLASHQIMTSEDSTTLFRNNTLATKCADYFMKMIGLNYLHKTVKEAIDNVFTERRDCEIDPSRMKNRSPALIRKHSNDLIRYLNALLDKIFSSVKTCPMGMRRVFANIKRAVTKNPNLAIEGIDTQYTSVSGFVFLRFFAPAVLSPNLFGIREEIADRTVARTLTLLAKSLQSIGNLGTSAIAMKEDYMLPLAQVIDENVPRVKLFIEELCDVTDSDDVHENNVQTDTSSPPLVSRAYLHEGRVGKSFKKKEVMLTKQAIVWQKSGKAGVFDGHIDLRYVRTVELMLQSTYGRKRVLQVVTSNNVLSIQLNSQDELTVWTERFREYLRGSGASVLSACHVGLLNKKGRWTCCFGIGEEAPPCSKTHTSVAVDPLSSAFSHNEHLHTFYATLVGILPHLETLLEQKQSRRESQDVVVVNEELGQEEWVFTGAAKQLVETLRFLEIKHLLLQKPLKGE
eukprot:m.58221 g.58221  ORF g.58221 m.58221 type:complete len:799 (+) comp11251_c0_seq2:55-2451(+)